ncbi:MAG: hypothetical protein ACREJU_20865, partial [Nitrospiraceae bacterium]
MPSDSASGSRLFSRVPTLSERSWGYLFIGPALVLMLLFAVAPILESVWLSFHRRLPIFNVNEFIGIRNYVVIAQDERFWA